MAVWGRISGNSPLQAAAWALVIFFIATVAISPMNGEDYGLALPLSAPSGIGHIGAIVGFVWQHAATWNARLGECLAIVELSLPKYIYISLQAGASIVVVTTVAALAIGRLRFDGELAATAILTGALTILLWPRLEIFFWQTVAAGYLQPLALILALLLVVNDEGLRSAAARSWPAQLGLVLLAIACGFSFENVGPALVAYLVLAAFGLGRRSGTQRLFLLLAAGVFVGWLALMLVPSTGFRMRFYRETLQSSPLTAQLVVQNAIGTARQFIATSGVFGGLAVLAAWGLLRRGLTAQLDLLLLAVPAALLVGGVALAPYVEPRSFILAWAVMLIVIVRCLHGAAGERLDRLALLAALVALPMSAHVLASYLSFARQSDARTADIVRALGTDACAKALPVQELYSDASPRVLNNRDPWVIYNLSGQVSGYFGCKLVPAAGTR